MFSKIIFPNISLSESMFLINTFPLLRHLLIALEQGQKHIRTDGTREKRVGYRKSLHLKLIVYTSRSNKILIF